MRTAARRRVIALLDEAEAEGRYLATFGAADRQAARRLARDGMVREMAPGVFARSTHIKQNDPIEHAACLTRALASLHPSWVFCGATAAMMHGLDIPYALARRVYVRSPRALDARHVAAGVRRSRRTLDVRPVEIDGIRVTPLADTVADCLLEYAFPYALAVADSGIKILGWERDGFQRRMGRLVRGRKGAKRARLAARFADARADNGGESQVRAYVIRHGFQIPELQVELWDPTDPSRHPVVDFYWVLPDGRVVLGEFDGKGKYRDEEMTRGRSEFEIMLDERQRESRLTLLGYPVLRFTWDDLRHPVRMERLLTCAGIPRDEDWARRWGKVWNAR